jgi:short-subunit dehydrogenase
MKKSGKCALLTGASAGIGQELARLLASDGHRVFLVARRRDRLEALAKDLTATYGVEVAVLAEDLADPAAPARIVDQVRAAGAEIDFLVNNAGFGSLGSFAEAERDGELRMVDVNVRALLELTHRCLPSMLARRQGRILNIASVAGFVPGPFMATYYASKAFVLSFTEALATELRGTGVTATAVCPGPTTTEFAQVAKSERTNLFQRGVADAASVARHGYRAMLAGKVVAIPGWKNKLSAFLPRIAPRPLVRVAVAWMNSKRT